MGSEWPTVLLGDEVELVTGFPFKSSQYTEHPDGIKLVRGDNIVQGHLRWDGVKRWPASLLDGLENYRLVAGDVVLAMDRPWIEAGLKFSELCSHDLPALLVQRVSRLRGKKRLHTRFLKYLIGSPYFTNHVLAVQTGTAVPHISGSQIKEFTFNLPPLPEQKAIAHILGSLDDKIELNRRMNATLEGMAQALFKSWFVDFDPVIDNALAAANPIPEELAERAQVRSQALANGTANRQAAKNFPDAFQLTEEMGWIPEGWGIGQMSDHALIEMGQSPKGDTYNSDGEGIPLLNGPVEFGPYFTNRSKWTTAPTKLSSRDDLIVCVRGSTTGRFVKSDGQYCLGRGVCSVRGRRSQCFVDQVFQSSITEMLSLATGSTFPCWSRDTISGFEVIVPPELIVDEFDEFISPKIERIESGFLESESLSKLRDTLLPKLVSGELRIPEVEKIVEEGEL